MKFNFKNLGAIDGAQVELAPLTIICGRNNTGKTYVTYAIYALLSHWRQLLNWQVEASDMDALVREGAVTIDLQSKIVSRWAEIQQTTGERWQAFLPQALAAPAERFKKTDLSFQLDLDDTWVSREFKAEYRSEQGKVLFSAEKAGGETSIEVVAVKDGNNRDFPRFALDNFVGETLLDAVFQPYFPTVFMVSTERTGAVAFKEELNLTKNKLVSFLSKMETGKEAIHPGKLFEAVYKRGYPLPVENNVQFVNRFASLEGVTGPLMIQYPKLANDFERIAGGKYETNKDGVTHFVPKGSTTKLQLSEASSAVRSLVVLWYWLKTQAASGEMLLVDEPELNLHPENQRAVARFLVKLVNLGVKVLITTHSDTLLRELNTLIMLTQNSPHMEATRHKYGYDSDDTLDPEKVRLYIANGHKKDVSGKKKRNSISTLECIYADKRLGLAAEIFDETIIEMAAIQDALRYGAI